MNSEAPGPRIVENTFKTFYFNVMFALVVLIKFSENMIIYQIHLFIVIVYLSA